MAVTVVYVANLAKAEAAADRLGYEPEQLFLGQLISRCTPGSEADAQTLDDRGLAAKNLPNDDLHSRRDKQWNPTTKVFDTIVPPKGRLPTDDFIDRFTGAEWQAISTVRNSDEATALVSYLTARKNIDLEDPNLETWLTALETGGRIAAGRKDQILAASARGT